MLNATKQLNLSLHSTLEKGFETSTTVFYKNFYQVATFRKYAPTISLRCANPNFAIILHVIILDESVQCASVICMLHNFWY